MSQRGSDSNWLSQVNWPNWLRKAGWHKLADIIDFWWDICCWYNLAQSFDFQNNFLRISILLFTTWFQASFLTVLLLLWYAVTVLFLNLLAMAFLRVLPSTHSFSINRHWYKQNFLSYLLIRWCYYTAHRRPTPLEVNKSRREATACLTSYLC